jgi:alpha-tubulin suppressor-like RCC1 family protein
MKKKITLLVIVLLSVTAHSQCWKSVSAGYQSTLAVKTDGTLWAWGDNDFGQLGTGNFVAKNAPVQVGTASDWKEVSCGENHVIALKTNGTLWAWGDNIFGQLGEGGILPMSNIPVQVGLDSDWQTISAGSYHNLALKTNGALWAWGWNFAGQVGDGTTTDVLFPTQIALGSTFKAISTGAYFSHAIKTNGTLWAWGDSSFGQLGDGTTNFFITPTQIGTANDWKSVDGGDSFTLAIKTNGTLWSWGANFEGNLGDGTLIDHYAPLQVGTYTNWKSISAKFYHVSGVKNNGTLWAWGFNLYGQLGDSTNAQKVVPTQIGTSNNWKEASAGVYHSMAIDEDGAILATGDDQFLQLGNGTSPTSNVYSIIGTCVSKVQNSQCGTTLPTINQSIYADLIPVAQGYRFKVTDLTTNQVQTIDKVLRVFQLTQLGNYAFNRSYKIEIAIRYNNAWQPYYGVPCVVTTPATTTQIQASQCGSTLTTMGDVIYADNVPFSSGYKFRITNLLSSAQEEIERPLRDIRITNTTNPLYNTAYSIEVAVKNTNGTFLPYGALCNITTPSFPTSQLQLSQCDAVITNNNETIYADSFTGATTYRFKFTNSTLSFNYIFDRPIRSFILSSIPGLLSATTYSVQVSIEINGIFGPYGKICTLTTPGGAREIAKENNSDFQVVAYPNPFVENFKLKILAVNKEVIQLKVYTILGNLIEYKSLDDSTINDIEIGNNYPTGIYNIIVLQGEEAKTVRVIKR